MMARLGYLCSPTELNNKPWKIIKRLAKVELKKVQDRLRNAVFLSHLANPFFRHWMVIIRHLTSSNRIFLKSRSTATKNNNSTTKDLMRKWATQPSLKRRKRQSLKMLMHLGVVNRTTTRSHEVIVSTTNPCPQGVTSQPLA